MRADDDTGREEWRVSPALPKGLSPFSATAEELKTHGLPRRPDPRERPHLAALWDRCASRYGGFEHLSPDIKPYGPAAPASLFPLENCGYFLTSAEPFVALFVHWTVPRLVYSPASLNENRFHTFVGAGFVADVHVDMTVDAAQQVSSVVTVNGGAVTNLPVAPGDAMSTVICINTRSAGDSAVLVGVANETTGHTVNLSAETDRPPAVSIEAGVTLDLVQNNPTLNRLPRFGVVYFDEISAYTTAGPRSLTADGTPVTMTDRNGRAIASPYALNEYAFKAVHR